MKGNFFTTKGRYRTAECILIWTRVSTIRANVTHAEPLTFTSRWDLEYEVFRIRGSTLWVRHQPTGKTKIIHRPLSDRRSKYMLGRSPASTASQADVITPPSFSTDRRPACDA